MGKAGDTLKYIFNVDVSGCVRASASVHLPETFSSFCICSFFILPPCLLFIHVSVRLSRSLPLTFDGPGAPPPVFRPPFSSSATDTASVRNVIKVITFIAISPYANQRDRNGLPSIFEGVLLVNYGYGSHINGF